MRAFVFDDLDAADSGDGRPGSQSTTSWLRTLMSVLVAQRTDQRTGLPRKFSQPGSNELLAR